jgi:hypothetical protein
MLNLRRILGCHCVPYVFEAMWIVVEKQFNYFPQQVSIATDATQSKGLVQLLQLFGDRGLLAGLLGVHRITSWNKHIQSC